MDEALFLVLEQISGILNGYVAGIRASKHIDNSPIIPQKYTSDMECIATYGNFKLYAHRKPKTQKTEVLEKPKQESQSESDKGADMKSKSKAVLRQDGRYQSYVIRNGKRYYVYAYSEQECLQKRSALEKKLPKDYKGADKTKQITLYEFGVHFVEHYKKLEVDERTYKQYLSIMNIHLKCDIPLNRLKVDDVQALINKLPPTSLREKVFSLLVQILKKAYAMDLIKKHMADLITKGKTERENLDALSLEDQRKLIANLDLDTVFGKRVLFYLLTGARPAEMHTVDQIKKGYVHIAGTKTKRSNRWVKLSDKAMTIFDGADEKLFQFDTKRFRQRLQLFVEQFCGIKSYVTVYTLRHTFATNLYYLGCPDKERASYMGHTTTKTTNDFYTSLDPTITAIDIRNIYGDLYPEF